MALLLCVNCYILHSTSRLPNCKWLRYAHFRWCIFFPFLMNNDGENNIITLNFFLRPGNIFRWDPLWIFNRNFQCQTLWCKCQKMWTVLKLQVERYCFVCSPHRPQYSCRSFNIGEVRKHFDANFLLNLTIFPNEVLPSNNGLLSSTLWLYKNQITCLQTLYKYHNQLKKVFVKLKYTFLCSEFERFFGEKLIFSAQNIFLKGPGK